MIFVKKNLYLFHLLNSNKNLNLEIELCAEGEDLPDLNKSSSTKQDLNSGVKYEYLLPNEPTEPDSSKEPNSEASSSSLADLMSKLKSL